MEGTEKRYIDCTGDEWIESNVAKLLSEPDRLRRVKAELEQVELDIQSWRADLTGLEYVRRYRVALESAITAIGIYKV